jgi:hypothetical protein
VDEPAIFIEPLCPDSGRFTTSDEGSTDLLVRCVQRPPRCAETVESEDRRRKTQWAKAGRPRKRVTV